MTVDIPAHYPEWVREHMQRYLSTDGADGHLWDAEPFGGKGMIPTLLLTTTGRKSGKRLALPLIYIETPGGWAVIGSKGGAPAHPGWYLNLSEDPEVGVQIMGDSFEARARTAKGAEREALWRELAELYPPFDEYAVKAAPREIPVVVLERKRD
jgi:deazaflavin-dependent oxidoreductase (nitroreductase family)